MTKRGRLSMSVESVRGYIGEVLEAVADDPDCALRGAAEYLFAIPAVRRSPFDSPKMNLMYFLSAYTAAVRERDNTDAEAAAANRISDEDVEALFDHALAHPAFEAAQAATRAQPTWLERVLLGDDAALEVSTSRGRTTVHTATDDD